jgi:hypothetical protein
MRQSAQRQQPMEDEQARGGSERISAMFPAHLGGQHMLDNRFLKFRCGRQRVRRRRFEGPALALKASRIEIFLAYEMSFSVA